MSSKYRPRVWRVKRTKIDWSRYKPRYIKAPVGKRHLRLDAEVHAILGKACPGLIAFTTAFGSVRLPDFSDLRRHQPIQYRRGRRVTRQPNKGRW